jgi:hypothetical protein
MAKTLGGLRRIISSAAIRDCPHKILDPRHFRPVEGTCRCDDPDHTIMASWGYEWKNGRWT